jgi:hypothetical protein
VPCHHVSGPVPAAILLGFDMEHADRFRGTIRIRQHLWRHAPGRRVSRNVIFPSRLAPFLTSLSVCLFFSPQIRTNSVFGRQSCADAGVTPEQCAARGCCWDNRTTDPQIPWCFHPAGGPPFGYHIDADTILAVTEQDAEVANSLAKA